jgi:hypothetical protein
MSKENFEEMFLESNFTAQHIAAGRLKIWKLDQLITGRNPAGYK